MTHHTPTWRPIAEAPKMKFDWKMSEECRRDIEAIEREAAWGRIMARFIWIGSPLPPPPETQE